MPVLISIDILDVLILGEGPTHRLGDTRLTPEKKYSVDFTESRKKFCLKF